MQESRHEPTPASRRVMILSVYLPTLLLSFGQGMLLPTLPLYARSFGVSWTLVGVALAAEGIGTLIADLPSGMWITRYGRKPVMLAGTALLALANLGNALVHHFPELIGFRVLSGMAGAMWGLSRHAFLTDLFPVRQRGRALSVFGGLGRIGAFAGPAVGARLAAHHGFQSPFLFNAAVSLLTLLLASLFIIEIDQPTGTGRALDWQRLARIGWTHRSDLSAAGAAQIFAQMIREGRRALLPLYGRYYAGLDIETVGWILSASGAIDMVMFIPAGWLMDRHGRKYAAIPSFLIMAVGMAVLPFAHSAGTLLAAAVLTGIGNGFGSGIMMTLGADLAPKGATGEFLGFWRLIGDVGSTGGPLVVGVVSQAISLPVAAVALCGIGLLASGTLARFVPETLAAADKVTR